MHAFQVYGLCDFHIPLCRFVRQTMVCDPTQWWIHEELHALSPCAKDFVLRREASFSLSELEMSHMGGQHFVKHHLSWLLSSGDDPHVV